jgi:hypothetical protein
MKTSPARALILTYGALMALFDLVALLPGNPEVTSVRGFVAIVVVQALLIWRLYRPSGFARSLVVLRSGSFAAVGVLAGGPRETTLVVSCLLALIMALSV